MRAALDLVAAVRTLGADNAVPGLAARAGVVTGCHADTARPRRGRPCAQLLPDI